MIPRLLAYLWAAPVTAIGLLIALPAVLTGSRARWVTGVLEVAGPLPRLVLRYGTLLPGGATAMTLGHVVIAVDAAALDLTRAHERVHVRQAEHWGPLFIPAYLGCSAWLLLRRRDPYRENPFERQAFAETDVPGERPPSGRR
jgi:hypothetical protein